jgi:hypothetical protein
MPEYNLDLLTLVEVVEDKIAKILMLRDKERQRSESKVDPQTESSPCIRTLPV